MLSKNAQDRFRNVSLNNPINALLFRLAIENKELLEHSACMLDEEVVEFPDATTFLELKANASLLPLETLKEKLKLPSVPGIVLQLQNAIEQGAPANHLAGIIAYDSKLAAAVMSMVNSPFYAMPMKIETLERAVTVLGTKKISSLALGIRLLTMFEDTAPESLPLESFWKHSIACAILANDIAILTGKFEPERFLVAGLLHDLGRIMLYSRHPKLAKLSMAMQLHHGTPLHLAEQELFDADHAMIGGVLFGEWGLPTGIVQSALYHHNPEKCLGKEVPEIIFVANQIVTAIGIGCNLQYTMHPGEAIWESLQIKESELRELVKNVEQRLWWLFYSLFPREEA